LTQRFRLVVIAIVVSGCANDYDQFMFGPGPQKDASAMDTSVPDVGAKPDGADASPSDTGLNGDREAAGDADARSQVDAPSDVAQDVQDAGGDRDGGAGEAGPDAAPDVVGPNDGGDDAADAADNGTIEDAGPDAADVEDAGPPDVSVGDDGGDADASTAPDVPVEADATPDVSIDNDAGPSDDGPVDVGIQCDAAQKRCGDQCVNIEDPATGCAGPTCNPCDLAHATARCDAQGRCAIDSCEPGFDDCDHTPENGCETSIRTDIAHCGACGRACSDLHVASKECSAGVCVSTCELGFGNCERPSTGPDDGCERAVDKDDANCGSCGNDCRAQAPGLVCGGVVSNLCSCTNPASCRVGGSGGTCDPTGMCRCGPSLCRPGETCRVSMGPDVCSCNDGAGCTDTETCCDLPAGCRNLSTDPSSCGACGHACPVGYVCAAGDCACDADWQCGAGSPGTCAAGQCVCNGTPCAPGKRCLPGGICG
jgi:hypothetical protein